MTKPFEGAWRDEGWLRQKYLIEKYSQREIAFICGLDHHTVGYWLRKLKIKIRPFLDSNRTERSRMLRRINGLSNPISKEHKAKMVAALPRGEHHHKWCGGRILLPSGYIVIRNPDHPRSTKRGYVFEHRLVLEKKLGRPLKDWEFTHHINGNKSDNRPENLMVMTNGEHVALHNNLRIAALPKGD